MPTTADVFDQARDLIRKRLAELDDERKRLESALAELGGKAAGRPRRGPGRPRGSGRKATARAPRRRREGGRADQAAKLVAKTPGITAAEVAKAMKIKPNYLYRVLPDLENGGRVVKRGRQYFPGKQP
jgi:hypothetical protein